jgi:medium-chain acyl-[acyl-carrier-protein] hydrolase
MRWASGDDRAQMRLFCFSHAGGGAASYRSWERLIGSALDVCAVQLPGRANRLDEPPIDDMQVLVERITRELAPHLGMPFAFFGHSMGAIVATEVCRSLVAQGLPAPMQLFVSGRRPPGMPDPNPPLRHLSNAAFLVEIQRRYAAIPAEVAAEPEVLSLLLPALRADIAALETHVPRSREPLDVPILAIGGADDPLTPRSHLEDWGRQTRQGVRVRLFPGGHFYLDACRDAVLAEIASTLSLPLRARVAESIQ